MPWLAAGLAPGLIGRRRLGRLDDVRGGWLGRVGGILASRGELPLQLLDANLQWLDGSLETDELGAQSVDLGL
jgi:hypothetical protein